MRGLIPNENLLRDDKTIPTIPHIHYSLLKEKEQIFKIVKESSKSILLNGIFDFSKFPEWYEKLVKRDPKDMNYLMPGAFYSYLMILLYYKDREEELEELLEGMK